MDVVASLMLFLSMLTHRLLSLRGQGSITLHDVIDNAHDGGVAQIRLEGVYIWPFRQLRMVANR